MIGYDLKEIGLNNYIEQRFPEKYTEIILKSEDDDDISCEIYDFLDSNDYKEIDQSNFRSFLSDDGPGFIGFVIADTTENDNCFDFMKLDITQMSELMEKVQKANNMNTLPKLMIGTRSC